MAQIEVEKRGKLLGKDWLTAFGLLVVIPTISLIIDQIVLAESLDINWSYILVSSLVLVSSFLGGKLNAKDKVTITPDKGESVEKVQATAERVARLSVFKKEV